VVLDTARLDKSINETRAAEVIAKLLKNVHARSRKRQTRGWTQQTNLAAHDRLTTRQETGLNNAIKLCRGQLTRMSNDQTLLISFFQSCDCVFELYAINDEFEVPVIMPLLTNKTRLLHIPAEEIRSFEGLTLALTREFRLTCRYRKLFNEAELGVDES